MIVRCRANDSRSADLFAGAICPTYASASRMSGHDVGDAAAYTRSGKLVKPVERRAPLPTVDVAFAVPNCGGFEKCRRFTCCCATSPSSDFSVRSANWLRRNEIVRSAIWSGSPRPSCYGCRISAKERSTRSKKRWFSEGFASACKSPAGRQNGLELREAISTGSGSTWWPQSRHLAISRTPAAARRADDPPSRLGVTVRLLSPASCDA